MHVGRGATGLSAEVSDHETAAGTGPTRRSDNHAMAMSVAIGRAPAKVLLASAARKAKIPADVVAELQDNCDLLALVEEVTGELRKTGREYRGWCPLCDSSKGLTVFKKGGRWRWYCQACKVGYGPIDWLMKVGGKGFLDAVALLGGDVDELRRVGVSPAVRERAVQKRAEREAREIAEAAERRRAAWAVWDGAEGVAGEAAETYLLGRGLHGPWPASLRFHPRVWTVKPDPLPDDRHHEEPIALPALVACVTSGDFKFLAVHRIFLGGAPDGSGRVVQAPCLPEDARKRALGDLRDGWVRLTDVPAAGGMLAVTEGIETGLAVVHAMRVAGRLYGEGGDVVVGAALFAGQLSRIGLGSWRPDRIVFMADHDQRRWNEKQQRWIEPTGEREAIAACIRAETEFGVPAYWSMPNTPGWDWNDPLMSAERAA